MQFRQLGQSGLEVSLVGLGSNNFGRRCDQARSFLVGLEGTWAIAIDGAECEANVPFPREGSPTFRSHGC